jgi:hypothetical protein
MMPAAKSAPTRVRVFMRVRSVEKSAPVRGGMRTSVEIES